MAAASPDSDGKEISLLLLGKTGYGKSATGNTILDWKAFRQSDHTKSETKLSKLHCSVKEDGTVVRVVDTPGLMDTDETNENLIAKIMEGISLCPNGFNALAFVIKYGYRCTKEEKKCLFILEHYFGANFLKDFGIVIMTQGDSFDLNYEGSNLTFEKWLGENKNDPILKQCNNRCVLFYNVGTEEKYGDKRKEGVSKLFELVQQLRYVYTSRQVDKAVKRETSWPSRSKYPRITLQYKKK